MFSSLNNMCADVVNLGHILFHINDISAGLSNFNITYRCVLENGGASIKL